MNQNARQTLSSGRMSGWGTPTLQPNTVSQAELRRIFEFQMQQTEIEQLIDLVQRKMELGASIEPGPMRVEITIENVETIDKMTLACFFGHAEVDALVQKVSTSKNLLKVIGEYDPLYPQIAPCH